MLGEGKYHYEPKGGGERELRESIQGTIKAYLNRESVSLKRAQTEKKGTKRLKEGPGETLEQGSGN